MNGNGTGPASLTEMRICRLDYAPEARVACVVLEGAANRSTSMMIMLPAGDAAPVMHALTPADGSCSAACDLVLAPARRLEAAVAHAVIDAGQDGISAQLALGHDAEPFLLTCHVADALTLAVRVPAPIYATRRALDRGVVSYHRASCGTKVRSESMPRRR